MDDRELEQRCAEALAGARPGQPLLPERLAERLLGDAGPEAVGRVEGALEAVEASGTVPMVSHGMGCWWRSETTPFGPVPLDTYELVRERYVNGWHGYYTGAILLNESGLRSWVPTVVEIVTDRVAKEQTAPEDGSVRLIPAGHPLSRELCRKETDAFLRDSVRRGCYDCNDPEAAIARYNLSLPES